MRVISGKYRGKRLESPKSDNVRPTGDKVKQALFTKLQFFVPNAVVLDLFCGSGALGIEALSRDAKKVYFVDKDKRSIALTKQNLKGVGDNYVILHCDYLSALSRINEKCNLILVDPPYASGVYNSVLEIIYNNKLLAKDGIIVLEHPNNMELVSPYEVFDQKRYGTVTLTYLKEKYVEE